mgnify:CR=1 FL=1
MVKSVLHRNSVMMDSLMIAVAVTLIVRQRERARRAATAVFVPSLKLAMISTPTIATVVSQIAHASTRYVAIV